MIDRGLEVNSKVLVRRLWRSRMCSRGMKLGELGFDFLDFRTRTAAVEVA